MTPRHHYWAEVVVDGTWGVQPIGPGEAEALLRDLASRRVGFDSDGVRDVSTVFLVMDHGHAQRLLYESMVFAHGTYEDMDCRRYATRDEAQAGHAALCRAWLDPASMAGRKYAEGEQ